MADHMAGSLDESLITIMDAATVEITRRLGGLELQRECGARPRAARFQLVTQTTGDFCFSLSLTADHSLLRSICRNMRHGLEPPDIRPYITEYFNILCGHVVTRFNQRCRFSARFEVPQVVSAPALCAGQRLIGRLAYLSPDGALLLDAVSLREKTKRQSEKE